MNKHIFLGTLTLDARSEGGSQKRQKKVVFLLFDSAFKKMLGFSSVDLAFKKMLVFLQSDYENVVVLAFKIKKL